MIGALQKLGPGTTAHVHFGVSVANLGDFSDACGSWYVLTDMIHEEWKVDNGEIWPLPGPGDGVMPDEDKIAQVRADF